MRSWTPYLLWTSLAPHDAFFQFLSSFSSFPLYSDSGPVNASLNQATPGGQANTNPSRLDVWSRFGLTAASVSGSFPAPGATAPTAAALAGSRDYVFKNNPKVDILGVPANAPANARRLRLQLAINTAQVLKADLCSPSSIVCFVKVS